MAIILFRATEPLFSSLSEKRSAKRPQKISQQNNVENSFEHSDDLVYSNLPDLSYQRELEFFTKCLEV